MKGSHVGEHDAYESCVTGEEVVLLGRGTSWDGRGLRKWGVVELGVLCPFRLFVRTEYGDIRGATCWCFECRRFGFSVQ